MLISENPVSDKLAGRLLSIHALSAQPTWRSCPIDDGLERLPWLHRPRPSQLATRGRESRASRTPGCSPATAPSSTTSTRPGMLHACFVRSPFARARIGGIDASAALALPGVHAVFTAADLNPDVQEQWHTVVGQGHPGHAAAAAGRGRGALRRRPGRARRRRQPLHRRGRGRAGRRRLRAAARRSSTTRKAARLATCSCTRRYPDNVAGGMGGAPPDEETFSVGRARASARRSTSRPTRRCRWRRAASSSSGRRRPAS